MLKTEFDIRCPKNWDIIQRYQCQLIRGEDCPYFQECNKERIAKDSVVELLKYDRLWKIIDDQLAFNIKEDEKGRKTTFLIMLTAFTEKPCHLMLLGDSAIGKTYLALNCGRLFPKENLVILGSATQRAWFYCGEEVYREHPVITNKKVIERYDVDWRNKIVIITDNVEPRTIKDLKSVMSHDNPETEIWATMQTPGGKYRTHKVRIIGCPSFTVCSTHLKWDEQLSTRHFYQTPRDAPEKYRAAGELIMEREVNGGENEPPQAEWVRGALRYLIKKDLRTVVKRGVAEKLRGKFKWNMGRDIRDYERSLALVKASAWIHALQRERDEEDRVIADERDLAIVEPLLDNVLATSRHGTSAQVLDFYERVLKPLANETENKLITREQIKKRYVEVYGRTISLSNLSKYIDTLETIGAVETVPDPEDRRKKRVRILD